MDRRFSWLISHLRAATKIRIINNRVWGLLSRLCCALQLMVGWYGWEQSEMNGEKNELIEFRSIIDWCQRVGRPLCFRFLSEILFRLFVRGPQSVSGQRPFWIFSPRFVRFYSIFSFFSGHFFFLSIFLSFFLYFSFLLFPGRVQRADKRKITSQVGATNLCFPPIPQEFSLFFSNSFTFRLDLLLFFFFYKREIQFSSSVSDISPRPAVTHPSIIIRFSLPSDWNWTTSTDAQTCRKLRNH